MESWNNIINTALLGTEKKTLRKEDFDAAIGNAFAAIEKSGSGGEETFLQTAAFVYNYRQCGFVPVKNEAVVLASADAEERPYASALAHAVLNDIINSGSNGLLLFWLGECSNKSRIALPEFLPTLFAAGVKDKSLQPVIITVCGKRGEWLSRLNEDWAWNETASDEERWQTGTLAQRRTVLAQTRKTDPAKAREMLQQTWPQESAAVKASLLEELLVNAGDEDLPWLESLSLAEKSTKVEAAVERLLGFLPASVVVQHCQNVLKQSIKLTTSKGVFGIGAKTLLELKLSADAREFFRAGVEEAKDKKITDEGYILHHLVSRVPPRFWEGHLSVDRKKVIALFAAEETHGPFIQALAKAAVRFNDLDWMRALLAADTVFHEEAFNALPQAEAETYALRFMADQKVMERILYHLDVFGNEWSLPFAKALLRFTASAPYLYNKLFYSNIAHLLPVPIVAELEKFTPKEDHLRHQWSHLSEHITQLLTLKIQTVKVFNE